MEWTPKNYKKLYEAVDLRISSLSIDRMKSDIKRHELYAKNTFTQGERDRIEEMCEYEDGINKELNHIQQLKNNVVEALDKLKEHIDK
jgi:hypothetical protein